MGRYLAGQSFGMNGPVPVLLEINEEHVAVPVATFSSQEQVLRVAELLNRHGMIDTPMSALPSPVGVPLDGPAL